MRRRQYLASVGIGVGGLASVDFHHGGADLEHVPPDDEIAVRPGTAVLFELAVPDEVDPLDVEWEAPDDVSTLVFATDYAFATGTAAFAPTFETSGTYEVRATPPGDEPVTWTVEVDDAADGPPVVEALSTEPGADETVGTDQPIEVTATVFDGAGNLGQVIWIEGRNETVVDRSSVEGDRDAATLELEETPHWIDYGYPTTARVVSEDGRVSDFVLDHGPTVRQPLEVRIVDTNAPVGAGETLEVTASVSNVGDMMMVGPDTQTVELVIADDVVDARSVSVPWSETTTITLSYETYPVRQDVEFPVQVRGEDDADEVTVSVYADAEPSVSASIVGTNAPVPGGDVLEVTAELENAGEADVTEEVRLVVADDVVDAETVTVGAGERRIVSLGYETYPVRQDVTFSVVVTTETDSDRTAVDVSGGA